MKDLLLTLLDPSTLSQAITQVVLCDNRFFEHRQEKRYELTSTIENNSTPLATQKNFSFAMLTQPLATSPKDDPT